MNESVESLPNFKPTNSNGNNQSEQMDSAKIASVPKMLDTSEFYLQTTPVESAPVTGATNLLQNFELNWAYSKFSNKKVKQPLSSFISHLPGPVDTPATEDESGLMALIEKPGPVLKEIKPLSGAQLTGFRLYPGPIPEQYKVPLLLETQTLKAKKHKKKKSKKHRHHSDDFEFNINIHSGNLNLAAAGGNLSKANGAVTSSITSTTSLSSTASIKSGIAATSTTIPSVTPQQVSSPSLVSQSQETTVTTSANTPSTSSSVKTDDQKKNRKRVYDDKKKKKEKKKKRRKEVLSD